MQDKPVLNVTYLGRAVPKNPFRVYVYGANNTLKLANSWEEFEKLLLTGLWFATKEAVPVPKPARKKPLVKLLPEEDVEIIEPIAEGVSDIEDILPIHAGE